MQHSNERLRKILIVDPDLDFVQKIQQDLSGVTAFDLGYQVCQFASDAYKYAQQEEFSCIILEYKLHDNDGLAFLESLRNHIDPALLPIILYTDQGSEQIAVRAFKYGIYDYLRKSEIKAEALCATVTRALMDRDAVKQHDRHHHQLRHLAYYDHLTALPNQTLLEKILELTITRAKRHQRQFAVISIDINNFKHVNATQGFAVGDKILMAFSVLLRSIFRESDTVAKTGSDDFVVILDEINPECSVSEMMDTLMYRCERAMQTQEFPVELSVAMGIAVYPEHGQDARVLLSHADAALYFAKTVPEKGYFVYSPEINADVKQVKSLERLLPQALEKEEFFLCYQPIVLLDSGKMVGIESLTRWQQPELGLVSPDKFITLAEKTGDIRNIGKWVISAACKQLHQWQQDGYEVGYIAVNVSMAQLTTGELPKFVNQQLKKYQIDPKKLKFELTESSVVTNLHVVETQLRLLREMGSEILLDDMGTGYSSLDLLRYLPISGVKITQSFVKDIGTREFDLKMINAMIYLAKQLGLYVVVEGVESTTQKEILLKQGCLYAQGNLFSEPLTASALTPKLVKQ